MNFQGKTVWITGGSAGIGKALAEELFSRGAVLILSARNTEKLQALKNDFNSKDPGRCHIIPCDITDPSQIDNAAALVMKTVPKLDILINNAGVSQRSYVMDTSIETERKLFELNYFGAVGVTKAILPFMINKGGGNIVVISSMAGKFGFRMRSTYSASKHALQGYFETLRAELSDKNVNVLLVCPGRIKTDISVNSLKGDGSKYGVMDAGQAKGVSVERCASIIVNALKRNRKEVFIGTAERFLLIIKRTIPSLYYWIASHASPT
ncbi:MAG TPA: SDR family oxidoreductase [Bacteroidales bacterium]|nr:SDR family oxidoreductase [Bacteroidales bacterium]